MPRSRARTLIGLNASVPALLIKIGHYPIHAGSLGIVRTLGTLGVPVYALTEARFTPVAVSRYVMGTFAWRGHHDADDLVEQLCAIGRVLGRRAVAVATDDDAAVLLAEYADDLRPHLLLPPVAPDLPRRLASKRGLYELCLAHDVPTPRTAFPGSREDLGLFGNDLGFPLIAKNATAGIASASPVLPGTTIVRDRHELFDRFGRLGDYSGLLLQEYIPFTGNNDWFVHAYCDADSSQVLDFVGRKAYSWPPARGVTADARSADNPVLRELAATFFKAIRYSGVNDLDWRYDGRDGRYKLVDFNPRVGAQFRFGVTRSGVDVVRALHLAMTDRSIPADDQDYSRRVVVENVHLPSRVRHRISGLPAPEAVPVGARTYGAWREGSARDPVPLVAMATRVAWRALLAVGRRLSRRATSWSRTAHEPQRQARTAWRGIPSRSRYNKES